MGRDRCVVALGTALSALLLGPGTSSAQPVGTAWDSIGVTPDTQIVYLHAGSTERPSETAHRVWARTRSHRARELYGIEFDRMLLQLEYDCSGAPLEFIWINLYRDDRLVESGRVSGRADPLERGDLEPMLERVLCSGSAGDPG